MGLFKKIFQQKSEPTNTYQAFWNWFIKNEQAFFKSIKNGDNIDENVFDKISPKLKEIKEGFYFLAGMLDDNTVDFIFSAEGNPRNIAFVEELVAAAPDIKGWKFTALKPAWDKDGWEVKMNGYKFGVENISFYANDIPGYPDEIDIAIVHDDLTEENKEILKNGIYIFLDNYLGELSFLTMIDNISIVEKSKAQSDLIPINKIRDYLIWREKEFVEKYNDVRHNTENDRYTAYEAAGETPLIAVMNTSLLQWDSKASHPWIVIVEIKFDGQQNNGLPDNKTYQSLDKLEDEISFQLKDADGYLNIGRQTANGIREIYYACKDFRKPSKVLYEIGKKYEGTYDFSYDIFKDKYWRIFERFDH